MEQSKLDRIEETLKGCDVDPFALMPLVEYLGDDEEERGHLDGLGELIRDLNEYKKIEERMGRGLICVADTRNRDDIQDDVTKGRGNGTEQMRLDQGALLLRIGSILRSFKGDTWTPEVKDHFDEWLNNLEKQLDIKVVPLPV